MKATEHFPLLKFKPAASALPFEVRTIQCMEEQMKELSELPHSHDYFEIIWVINGSGKHYVDMQACNISNNQVFCIKPGQLHRFVPDINAEGFVFSFTESFLNIGELEFDLTCQTNLFQLFAKANGIIIGDEVVADMKEVVAKMLKEFDNLYLFKTEILKRYLKIFLIYLTRQFEESFQAIIQTRNTELTQSFIKLLEKNFKEKKMVSEYANELYVTPNYLNEIVKKNTGYSASHHIRQRVVLEAKRIALYSTISMKEIAYELGFSDTGHFSKFFKGVTGANFTDFKKEKMTLAMAV